jgi:hypothetical protein
MNDAPLCSIAAAEIAGIRAVLLHAMSDDASHSPLSSTER